MSTLENLLRERFAAQKNFTSDEEEALYVEQQMKRAAEVIERLMLEDVNRQQWGCY